MSTAIKLPHRRRSERRRIASPRPPVEAPVGTAERGLSKRAEKAGDGSLAGIRAHVVRWLLGFAVASVAVTGLSPYFISTLRVYQWSDPIGDYVLKEGYIHRERDEGWASTRYGPWGIAAFADADRSGRSTILIWGDSYIEAHQISDDLKVEAQLNRMLAQSGSMTPIRAVSVGHSYWSVVDYYYHMPSYDKLLEPACHFIVLAEHGLKDLCPDEESFRSRPEYAFVPRSLVDPRRNDVTERLDQWHLADLSLAPWKAMRTLEQDARNLRFRVGPCARPSPTDGTGRDSFTIVGEPSDVVAAWSFAIDRLKSATSKPIVFVLVPEVPYLEHGTVRLENPQAAWTARLAELCKAKGVGLIDMTDVLVQDYLSSGVLSRGFNNGRPGSGHLNARGHALMAGQIQTYLEDHRDRQ